MSNKLTSEKTLNMLKQILEIQKSFTEESSSTKDIDKVIADIDNINGNGGVLESNNRNNITLSDFLNEYPTDKEILLVMKTSKKKKSINSPKNYYFKKYKSKNKKEKKLESKKKYFLWYKKYKNLDEMKNNLECENKRTLLDKVGLSSKARKERTVKRNKRVLDKNTNKLNKSQKKLDDSKKELDEFGNTKPLSRLNKMGFTKKGRKVKEVSKQTKTVERFKKKKNSSTIKLNKSINSAKDAGGIVDIEKSNASENL